ncbi:hypothetical protein GOBAR_DD30233 [Gossypium barbadense]|nr:hypothetical protein GOBAR_DD30233 [Gossypium barbadense]
MLSSSRIKDFHSSRSQAVDKLIDRLRAEAKANGSIVSVLKSACFIVLYILLGMCFGIEMDEETLIHNPDIQSKLFDEIKTTEATTVGVFNIPIDPNLEFFFPGITEDHKIWSNPKKFNPADRFYLGKEDADITGVTMVKMKPFGAGTRICPGLTMATVHIHQMLARMVQQIERTSYPPNSNIDFSGKFEFTVVMSNTLKARIKPMGGIR